MSNHKTKRRDGPTSDYVRPLTAEEKARPVAVHPIPPSPKPKPQIDQDAENRVTLWVMYTYARLASQRAPYSQVEPLVNWLADRLGLDKSIDKTPVAPLVVQADKTPDKKCDILPQALQDVNDVLEQNARKSPVSAQYRELVETTLEAYVSQANGHPIRITSDNYIKREQTEVRMYCRFLDNDDRDGFLVGVALSGDDPARPVYKGPELLAYLELCHKAGEEFRKRMVGKKLDAPPFACQTSRQTGTSRSSSPLPTLAAAANR